MRQKSAPLCSTPSLTTAAASSIGSGLPPAAECFESSSESAGCGGAHLLLLGKKDNPMGWFEQERCCDHLFFHLMKLTMVIEAMLFYPLLDLIIVISDMKFLGRTLLPSVSIAAAGHTVQRCLIGAFYRLVGDCERSEMFAEITH